MRQAKTRIVRNMMNLTRYLPMLALVAIVAGAIYIKMQVNGQAAVQPEHTAVPVAAMQPAVPSPTVP